ncbi:MAG TPA: hypothetical protein VFY93_00460 [Planctomycetota bacterium]|nr:hypothetical protein [Planctomycetota bacterium]
MAPRRAFKWIVLLAAAATAWLVFCRGGPDRGERASLHPAPGPAVAAPDASGKKAAPGEAAAATPAGTTPEASSAESRIRVLVIHVDGAPAAGARVEAYELPCDLFRRRSPTATAITARDGAAMLAVAPGVSCEVRASRGHAASFPGYVAPAGGQVVLILEPARALQGLVLLPEGAPARGYRVNLTFGHAERTVPFRGRTDGAGAFELPPLPDAWFDRLTAEVRPPAGASLPALDEDLEVVFKDPATPPHWEFEFAREQLVAGLIILQLTEVRLLARVVDEAGIPVAGAAVHWAPRGAPDPPSFRFIAVTDEEGRFEAAVQRVSGEPFVISAEGYAPLVWRPEAPPAARKLHVPEIVLRRGVPLHGRVTDPSGQPLRAVVRLESPRLPGQIVDQDLIDDDGRFRFGVEDVEHVLYAFRPVQPDLCLPQLKMAGVRGGQDEVHVVLPEPIRGSLRFVAQGTGEALEVQHLTLIVKDARGTEVAKRTWEPALAHRQVRFEVWVEGTYSLEVYAARHEPASVEGVQAVRGRGPDVAVSLVPRR